jgi:uncharacterized protein (UPF0264 family)
VAGLLVSVRSAAEAVEAVAGGAAVIDVKEPARGPLGRANASVWGAVRAAVPPELPVSVALGELREWSGTVRPDVCTEDFAGVAFRKLGLADAGPRWRVEWSDLRRELAAAAAWVAVVYADWPRAAAPHPDAVLDAALLAPDCAGILVDTWDKSRASPLAADAAWRRWIARARAGPPRLITLAGRLDCAAIARLAPLEPDYFAVRGAACAGGNRDGAINRARVANLVRTIDRSARAG